MKNMSETTKNKTRHKILYRKYVWFHNFAKET